MHLQKLLKRIDKYREVYQITDRQEFVMGRATVARPTVWDRLSRLNPDVLRQETSRLVMDAQVNQQTMSTTYMIRFTVDAVL